MYEYMKKQKLVQWYKNIEILLDNMNKDHISESSAQSAYYTILSFIPFIILVITLIQYTGIKPDTLFEAISNIVPSSMSPMVLEVVKEVFSKSIGTISISLIFTLWSAGRGLFALTVGLHTIFHTDEDKNKITSSYAYLRIKSLLQTLVFIFVIVLGLMVLVFGSSLIEIIQKHFETLENYTILSKVITNIAFIFVTFLVFIILYKFVGRRKVTFKSQIYGAFLGAISLNVVSFVFSRYLYIFKGFSITYGSLTTLMLVMMWTYSCFYTVFVGAEINKWINEIKNKKNVR